MTAFFGGIRGNRSDQGSLKRLELGLKLFEFLLGAIDLSGEVGEFRHLAGEAARFGGSGHSDRAAAGTAAKPARDGELRDLELLRSRALAATAFLGVHFINISENLALLLLGVSLALGRVDVIGRAHDKGRQSWGCRYGKVKSFEEEKML